jgi:hypothetical protein
MTGQDEIEALCRKLRRKFPARNYKEENTTTTITTTSTNTNTNTNTNNTTQSTSNEEIENMNVNEDPDIDFDLDSDEEDNNETMKDMDQVDETVPPLHVLPLYSMLPSAQQMKVFQDPPKFSRLVVVATNVAETSLTIPGIRYVVDCGKVKEVRSTSICHSFKFFNWSSRIKSLTRNSLDSSDFMINERVYRNSKWFGLPRLRQINDRVVLVERDLVIVIDFILPRSSTIFSPSFRIQKLIGSRSREWSYK